MAALFSMDFQFELTEFSCLVSTRIVDSHTAYKITVMNGDLEKLLTGENLINEKNGKLEIPATDESRKTQLKYAIAIALQQRLDSMQLHFVN